MNELNPELLDRLASEFVLGTLRGAARRRLARLIERSDVLTRAVRRWEDRFVGFALAVRAVQPSGRVWSEVAKRVAGIDRTRPRRARAHAWQIALAASLTGVIVALGWYRFAHQPHAEAVAIFASADGAQLWRVQASQDTTTLSMETVGAVTVQPGHSYELWALPQGHAPVSLGLMPTAGSASETLTEAQRMALRDSRKLAISLEPQGGSPTGVATGPVVHVADWVHRT